MQKVILNVLQGVANINGNKYSMYSGFLPAASLIQIAEVPSFDEKKPHHKIADDVSKLPIDEWQRPEDQKKINIIKEIYGDRQKDNLMANPVLLGTAIQNLNPPEIAIQFLQKTVTASNGQIIPIENHFDVTISFDMKKDRPLWILDGQHRIKGLALSIQKNELVPFVLLHDLEKYTPPFLAEIFTHVSTGAKPMEPVHGEWMKYAFKLDHYRNQAHKSAMEATIILCREPYLGGLANPFNNKIQFNPYIKPAPKWNSFEFNSIEWEKIISQNYFGKGGKLSPFELAEEITKAIISFESLDSHANIDSKIFSTNKSHKILAEAFLIGLLTQLQKTNKPMLKADWDAFFLDSRRAVNRCNFSLPFVKTTGALSSNNGKPSKLIATNCFTDFFINPNDLNGSVLSDFLQGIGGSFTIEAYKSLPHGGIDKKTKIEMVISSNSGMIPFDLSVGSITRDIIKIRSNTSNIFIQSVSDFHYRPAVEFKQAHKSKGEYIGNLPNNYEIDVIFMSYSGDTRKQIQIRLDR
jgi:hypothetical protein